MKMKLGIMQPYFIPYIGYWQLLNAVDKYVIYDDVNYIKGGWINRNRIMNHGKIQYVNINLKAASPNRLINQIEVDTSAVLRNKTLRMIENCYSKAANFEEGYALLQNIFLCAESNLALFLKNSIEIICDYLDIQTELLLSSDIKKNNKLKGQDKVLKICEILQADTYYNSIGGSQLYSFEQFREKGVQLCFFKTKNIVYEQQSVLFEPNLSIMDVIMNCSKEQVRKFLNDFELVRDK